MKIIICVLCWLSIPVCMQGQAYYIRAYAGLTYYQGDLSPQTSALSFSPGHQTYAIHAGTKLSDLLTLGTRFLKGKISGDDKDAKSAVRRRRNLHFESNIYELGLLGELSFNHIFKKLNRYRIKVSLVTGINVYHYNPKALYEGKWIALHRLMTEGQGLRTYLDQKPYHLTKVNFPIGLSAQFSIAYNLRIGFEISPRITFNDYLDDVSTMYINYNELTELKGELTAIMANRTGELTGSGPVLLNTGAQRGDPNDNDWYTFTGIYLAYIIGAKKPPPEQEIELDQGL